jgi:acyl CoA:acetate/3-ketoacid CoA transferase beta subunit
MLCDVMQVYGWLVAGTDKCLAVLGGAEIDKQGNINSTLTSNGAHLVGSGGANDASNAAELMLVVTQSRQRFVDKVSYVTVPGSRVTTLISDLGIFERPTPDKEFVLTAYFPQLGVKEESIRHIKEQCGWELNVSPDVKQVPSPTQDELTLLRLLDAGGALIRPR